jgi:hypothetical protein
MNCPHYSRDPGNKHNGNCALGWYGGKPFAGQCLACIKANQNTADAYAKAQARYEKSHPAPFRGISGCCDNATNYPL